MARVVYTVVNRANEAVDTLLKKRIISGVPLPGNRCVGTKWYVVGRYGVNKGTLRKIARQIYERS